jgi:tetratricopeptide (TPR) repeat protein
MKWHTGWLAAAVIAAAGLGAYANSFSGAFVLDDVTSIVDNPTIRHLTHVRAILAPPAGNGLTVGGRPLVNLSLAVNYAIGGTRVWSYHALNLAIHILAGLALFGIVRRTLEGMARRPGLRRVPGPDGPGLPALAVALLWVLHPLQTESVTYVVQRAESLMGLFYLLTLYCFIRYAECRSCGAGKGGGRGPERMGLAGLSAACCLLGAASKEVMVTAPLMVWLYDRTFVSGTFRSAWREHRVLHLGLACSWILIGLLAFSTNARGHSVGFDSGIAWPAYARTQFGAVAHYLSLSFWPHPLVFDYGSAVAGRLGDVIPQLAVVIMLLAATLVALWRWPVAGFCGAWFFAVLAPTSSVVPVGTQTIAEHRMYLPLAAVVALAVLALCSVAPRRSLPVLLAAALGLGFLTARRNEDYRSALSIWGDTVSKRPESWRAQSSLGAALAADPGRVQEALSHYEEALRLKPNSAEVQNNLAIALAGIPGHLPEAILHYGQALRLRPNYAEAHNNMANALARIPGRLPEAISHYEEALRLKPDSAEVRYNLANALAKDPGLLPEAVSRFEEALSLNPAYAEAHNGLANALAKDRGRLPEAISHYEEALRLRPDFAEAQFDLANAMAKSPGRLPEAISHYKEALRLKPDSAEAHNNLAVALAETPGRLPEAVSHFQEALRLKPDYVEAHNDLAIVLAETPGRLPEAIPHFEEVLRLKPDFADAHFNIAAAYARLGRLDEAIAHLEAALRLNPGLAGARENLGKLREIMDKSRGSDKFGPKTLPQTWDRK